MTTIAVVGGLIIVVALAVWWATRWAMKAERADIERETIEAAKEVEDAMDEITDRPSDPEKTKRKFEDGTA